MDNNFELNKAGWFIPQNVEANDFLNDKLDSTDYGIFYSVKFQGDASTHLWQAKTAPVEGEKYFGMLIMTKSGKSTKFKRLKPEDYGQSAPQATQSPSNAPGVQKSIEYWDDKDARIQAQFAIKAAIAYTSSNVEADMDYLEGVAKDFFAMVDRVKVKPTGYDKAKAVRSDLSDKTAGVVYEDAGAPDLPADW